MNNITIAGNVGKSAEIRSTQNGDKLAGFSVAVDNGKDANGNRRDATWFDCTLWGKRAEALAPYIVKGGKVTVSGRVSARAHDGKAYLQISVQEITLQGGGERQQESRDDNSGYAPSGDMDDEIPF